MHDDDQLDRRLRATADDVRSLSADPSGRYADVTRIAGRRAAARRGLGALSLLVAVGGVVAAVTTVVDDDGRMIAATSADDTVEDTTTATAPASTTSTPASTSTTAPSETTTTTTTTTVAEPEPTTTTTATPAWAQPPAAHASGRRGEVQAAQGSSCWRSTTGEAATCADVAAGWEDAAPVLEITSGEPVLFRWDIDDQPKRVESWVSMRRGDTTAERSRRDVECAGGNPCRIRLDLPRGEYVLTVSSHWHQGDVMHAVRLQVG